MSIRLNATGTGGITRSWRNSSTNRDPGSIRKADYSILNLPCALR